MGSSADRMIMKDGVLVKQKHNSITKKVNQATFEQIRVHFGQKQENNAITLLRKLDDIKDFVRKTYTKMATQI
jgi:hypothetical protein